MNFESSVHEIDEVTREIVVSIAAPLFLERVTSRLSQVQRTTAIKGFRPGKAPIKLVSQLHGKNERLRVLDALINESLSEVIKKNDLTILGSPAVTIASEGDEGKDVEYSAKLFLLPQPVIDIDTSIEIKVPRHKDVSSLVDEHITSLCKQSAKFTLLEDRNEVLDGDGIDLRYGTLNSADTKELSSDASQAVRGEEHTARLEISPKTTIPELYKAVIGKERGKKFEVSFTEDLQGSEKPTNWWAEVDAIYTIAPAERDDELAKKSQPPCETFAELESAVRVRIEAMVASSRINYIDSEIMGVLAERSTFKIPEIMIQEQLPLALGVGNEDDEKAIELRFRAQWISLTDEEKSSVKEEAEAQVRDSIILSRCAAQLNVKIEEEDITNRLQQVLKEINEGGRQLTALDFKRYSNAELVGREVLMLKTLALLRERTTVEEVDEIEHADS
jgi:trigger factor